MASDSSVLFQLYSTRCKGLTSLHPYTGEKGYTLQASGDINALIINEADERYEPSSSLLSFEILNKSITSENGECFLRIFSRENLFFTWEIHIKAKEFLTIKRGLSLDKLTFPSLHSYIASTFRLPVTLEIVSESICNLLVTEETTSSKPLRHLFLRLKRPSEAESRKAIVYEYTKMKAQASIASQLLTQAIDGTKGTPLHSHLQKSLSFAVNN